MSLKKSFAALAVVPLLFGLAACSSQSRAESSAEKGSVENPVVLGVMDEAEPYWQEFLDAAAGEDIHVELKNFTEGTLANDALADGSIDINQFQHIIFLAQYNDAKGSDLVPVGATAIFPLALYSTQFESVDEIPDGAEISVPFDETNLSRSLLVLQAAGLISLKDGGSPFSTVDDIEKDASTVEVVPVEPSLTSTTLPDVAGAIVNNNFAADAGLGAEELLTQDDPTDPSAFPYINIFATQADDASEQVYADLVRIFQETDAVQQGVIDSYGDSAVLVDTPVDELLASLEETTAQVASSD
ncbi:MetQ/NlpA family ABC transporter substrate-binding protein [Paramicrobacterium sp. CJ85]|uniref:MetQ/NlpA family ABC transporter substrate-binding protein n=1 Tax=Paramicrobacterium sp. CJ85 TaxID=3445355 RepID=UPI003F62F288